jgi:hypothetical protein
MRVNARLDAQTAAKLEDLTASTRGTVSDVLRDAIGVYHQQVGAKGPTGGKFMLLALAGKGDSGLGDLSTRYKEYFTEAMDAKWPREGRTTKATPPVKKAARNRRTPTRG